MTSRRLLTSLLSFVVFLVVTSCVVATGGIDTFDSAVHQAVIGLRHPALTALATVWTTLGSFPVVVGIAVAAAVALRIRTHRWVASAVLATSVAVTAGAVYLIKIAVGRTRPATDALLGAPSLDYAFPSGHTTDGTVAIVLAAVLIAAALRHPFARRLLPVAGVLIAVGIGLSRVYLGYHWATDVVAGWALATTVVGIATCADRALGGSDVGSDGDVGVDPGIGSAGDPTPAQLTDAAPAGSAAEWVR